jgi:hypothetical protein
MQVRTRLAAGGKRIRTLGRAFTKGSAVLPKGDPERLDKVEEDQGAGRRNDPWWFARSASRRRA